MSEDLIGDVEDYLRDERGVLPKPEPERLANFVENLLQASSIGGERFAREICRHDEIDRIPGPIGVHTTVDVQRFKDNPIYAGLGVSSYGSFGPRVYQEGQSGIPLDQITQDYGLDITMVGVAHKADDSLISGSEGEAIHQRLQTLSDERAFGVSFNVQTDIVSSETDDKLATDRVITISQITDQEGNAVDVGVKLNLGYSDEVSELLHRGKTKDEYSDAREKMDEVAAKKDEGTPISLNDLVVQFTIPRLYGFEVELKDSKGEMLRTGDPDIRGRMGQGFMLMKKIAETVIEQKSGHREIISVPERTATEMVKLDNKDPDVAWLNSYR